MPGNIMHTVVFAPLMHNRIVQVVSVMLYRNNQGEPLGKSSSRQSFLGHVFIYLGMPN